MNTGTQLRSSFSVHILNLVAVMCLPLSAYITPNDKLKVSQHRANTSIYRKHFLITTRPNVGELIENSLKENHLN